jgi:magnesium chelatase subunit D
VSKADIDELIECVAINDALDGMLLYGASGALLDVLANRLAEALKRAGISDVDRVRLGAADSEDTLWGVPNLPKGWGGQGLLVPPDDVTRIVLVPDLARVSLAAARAGVVSLGGQEVQLERRSASMRLRLRNRWLAAVADEDLGKVSPHLLDRFAIRVRADDIMASERVATLRESLGQPRRAKHNPRPRGRIESRAFRRLPVNDEAIDTASTLACHEGNSSLRGAIALLEVARALANRRGKPVVDETLVWQAAALLDLDGDDAAADSAAAESEPGTDSAAPTLPVQDPKPAPALAEELAPGVVAADATAAQPSDLRVAPETVIESVPLPAPAAAAESDSTVQPRDYNSLRLPWRQNRSAATGHGPVIGVRRSESLQDLAVIETLFAAAPHQKRRRRELGMRRQDIVLLREDLRSYRRAPSSSEVMILVLDYTSVRGNEWLDELVPYLSSAYSARAELCVVKVGAKSATNEFRADRLLARNVLVPSVAAALDEVAGVATPLADGLMQAWRTLQQTMTHGRASKRTATLVLVTDGRGNVPLASSQQGKWLGRVGREGVEDARRVAREIRALPNVRSVLLNPGPRWAKDLPVSLGAALGAEVLPFTSAAEKQRA